MDASPARTTDPEFGALQDTFDSRFRANSPKKALVYERGLVLVGRGGSAHRFAFDDLRVRQEIVERRLYGFRASTAYRFVLTGPDGLKKVMTNVGYRRIAELGQMIQGRVVQAQLPGVMEKLRRGDRIEFGKLFLSREGIGTRRRHAAWSEIETVGLETGFFVVAQRGKRLNIAVEIKGVENVFVLLAAVQRILDAHSR